MEIPAEIRDGYLELPPLDPRIPALARSVTASASSEFDRAVAIQNYLQTEFGYTLEQPSPAPADPLAHFLFERRKGHCEYFATAMTVMLRTIGIPARYVTGFLPGEFNEVAGDYIVRASDAHAWVEVYFPDFGWITFDPTPPAAAVPRGFFARLAFYWDWVELNWNDWVINFDFIHQATMMQNLQRGTHNWSEKARTAFEELQRSSARTLRAWQSRLSATTLLLLVLLGLLVGCFFLIRSDALRRFLAVRWGARFAAKQKWTPQIATLHYEEMLRLLARRGWRKAPGTTPVEFASSLPAADVAMPVVELTDIYQSARFGAHPLDARSLTALLDRIRAVLRAKPRRSAPTN
jgi:hypothetical protein